MSRVRGAIGKARAKPAIKVRRARADRLIPVGDNGGVMRADKGDYICTSASGVVKVKPPSVFALEGAK